jgi:hypothetical protein
MTRIARMRFPVSMAVAPGKIGLLTLMVQGVYPGQ